MDFMKSDDKSNKFYGVYGFYDVSVMTKITKPYEFITKVIKSSDKICGIYDFTPQKSHILWILWIS